MRTIYYAGLWRKAFVIEYTTRQGRAYVEAIIEGFKIAKMVDASFLKPNVA